MKNGPGPLAPDGKHYQSRGGLEVTLMIGETAGKDGKARWHLQDAEPAYVFTQITSGLAPKLPIDAWTI